MLCRVSRGMSVCDVIKQALAWNSLAGAARDRGDDFAALVHHANSGVLLEILPSDPRASCPQAAANLATVRQQNAASIRALTLSVQEHIAGCRDPHRPSEEGGASCKSVKQLLLAGDDCIGFDDISGMEREKGVLRKSLIEPLQFPRLFGKLTKGILFYGLPGTGKTFLVRAAVNELQQADPSVSVMFFAPTAAELKGKYVGETEQKIAAVFDCAGQAAATCAGHHKKVISVIFFDEFEALAGSRTADPSGNMTSSVNMLLQKMDGISSAASTVVLAATNFPWKIDSAVRRRYGREVHVPLPTPDDILVQIRKSVRRHLRSSAAAIQPAVAAAISDDPSQLQCGHSCSRRLTVAPGSAELERYCPLLQPIPGVIDNEDRLLSAATRKSQHTELEKLCAQLALESFSSSDVARTVARAISMAAERARRHGKFVVIDSFVVSTLGHQMARAAAGTVKDIDQHTQQIVWDLPEDRLHFVLPGCLSDVHSAMSSADDLKALAARIYGENCQIYFPTRQNTPLLLAQLHNPQLKKEALVVFEVEEPPATDNGRSHEFVGWLLQAARAVAASSLLPDLPTADETGGFAVKEVQVKSRDGFFVLRDNASMSVADVARVIKDPGVPETMWKVDTPRLKQQVVLLSQINNNAASFLTQTEKRQAVTTAIYVDDLGAAARTVRSSIQEAEKKDLEEYVRNPAAFQARTE